MVTFLIANIVYYLIISIPFVFAFKLWYSSKKVKPIIISIDGNIGSGKSTLIKILQDELCKNSNIVFLQEPVNEWIEISDGKSNILSNFYQDKKRWSYTFQNFAFITRSKMLLDAIKNNTTSLQEKRKVIITERSTETDKNIFAKMLHDEGSINDLEFKIYNYWYDNIMKSNKINNIIYLRTTPKDAYKRIDGRGRQEEKEIPLDYIQTIHEYHDKWLVEGTKNSNICYIDGNDDFQNNEKVKKNIVKSISVFINSLESRFYLPS